MAKQSVFYFIASATEEKEAAIYQMAATTDISITRAARATKSRVESGKSITDNYHIDNWNITFNGIITNVGIYREGIEDLETSDWIQQVDNLRTDQPLRTLTVVADNIVISNCLITNFTANKTKTEGFGGWRVNLAFQELEFADKAKLTVVTQPSEQTKNDTGRKTTGNSQTTKALSESVGGELIEDAGIYVLETGRVIYDSSQG